MGNGASPKLADMMHHQTRRGPWIPDMNPNLLVKKVFLFDGYASRHEKIVRENFVDTSIKILIKLLDFIRLIKLKK